jgi:hypothetical protein
MIKLADGKELNLETLKEPFKNIHFRPKTCYGGRVLLLAYLDSRDVMNRLDTAIGPENWTCDYKEIKGNLYCGIGIAGVYKWGCGVESREEKQKGEASDAFKRAAVLWGIGRYLYYLPQLYVEVLNSGDKYIKIKDNKTKQDMVGYYNIPKLPAWAYPKEENK